MTLNYLRVVFKNNFLQCLTTWNVKTHQKFLEFSGDVNYFLLFVGILKTVSKIMLFSYA